MYWNRIGSRKRTSADTKQKARTSIDTNSKGTSYPLHYYCFFLSCLVNFSLLGSTSVSLQHRKVPCLRANKQLSLHLLDLLLVLQHIRYGTSIVQRRARKTTAVRNLTSQSSIPHTHAITTSSNCYDQHRGHYYHIPTQPPAATAAW